ncbi:ROK family transcriptional regulator [Acidaminobacter sp. JC074]|uniref:ROK family transcriptional regulator n=1 Tax=Acidaminobacter sp. JC074 TaxID=2530199 RepID=UPI001F0D4750|nr:ROK family transcriptional regulator [Acidaminobacter sp. JC074]MCH4889869.1 ROK family transcriptional regulator [Acidaminobacter sp. JC074]
MKHIVNTEQKLEQSQIKERNRAMILNAFRNHEFLQKQDLVKMLGLSITTVTTFVNELLEAGLIQKRGIAKSTGGRKPLVLELSKSSRFSIGLDISPQKISIVFMNLMSEILIKRVMPYEDLSLDEILDRAYETITSLIKELNLNLDHCLGLGLSLPGIVDEEHLTLINAPNLSAKTYDFKAFRQKLNMPLLIENEANIAAFAEIHLGKAIEHENIVYLSLTDGVGCGIVVSGKVFKSSYKRAGEFGHMRISDQPIKCSCGRTGCWELFASERALLRFFEEEGGRALDIEDFFKQYDSKPAKEALKTYYHYLSLGIENIMLALDPEQVIIGGEIAFELRKRSIDIKEKIQLNSSILNFDSDIVVMSEMTPFSSVIGACLLPMIELFGL